MEMEIGERSGVEWNGGAERERARVSERQKKKAMGDGRETGRSVNFTLTAGNNSEKRSGLETMFFHLPARLPLTATTTLFFSAAFRLLHQGTWRRLLLPSRQHPSSHWEEEGRRGKER